jgi:hypothetical protein
MHSWQITFLNNGAKEDFMAIVKLMMKDPSTEEFRQAIDAKSVKMQCLEQIQLWDIK